MLQTLGIAELSSADPAAIEHLQAAFSLVEDSVRRGQFAMPCALALALANRFDAAAETLHQAIGGLDQDQPELREPLEAAFLNFRTLDARHRADVDRRIASIREETLHGGLGAAMMRAVLANYEVRSASPGSGASHSPYASWKTACCGIRAACCSASRRCSS